MQQSNPAQLLLDLAPQSNPEENTLPVREHQILIVTP